MPAPARPSHPADAFRFFLLACAITWSLDYPNIRAWLAGDRPPSYALPLVGVGALGPAIAAFLLAARRGELRDVFGRWRTNPGLVLLGLALPAAVHLPATLLEVALGGHPAHWFYPPDRPELVVALFVFALGEEVGWRGFAYPRLAARLGPVFAAAIVGAVWGLWHLGMLFAPGTYAPLPMHTVGIYVVDLSLWSVLIAWLFERSGRSLAVAIAVHAGGHLDDVYRAPESELRLRLLRFLVLFVAAALAARALHQRTHQETERRASFERAPRLS